MRNKIIIVLIIIAIPLYVWDFWLIISNISGKFSNIKKEIVLKNGDKDYSIPSLRIVHFEKKGKSPFLAYTVKPKPVVRKKTVKVKATNIKKEIKPPRIKITGIMWNPANPVAMVTLPDGTNTVAKAGKSLGSGIEVKKIEKNRIQIVYQGKAFWILK